MGAALSGVRAGMTWLIGNWAHLGTVAGKAALMYGTALAALRVGQRRTVAQWTLIDFATAVAIGAIGGRTATAGTQSCFAGAVALVTLITTHRIASLARFSRAAQHIVDHPVRVLVARGSLRRKELRLCGLTDADLFAELRERGVFSLDGLRYVLYERKGALTVVPDDAANPDLPLVEAGIDRSVGYR